MKETSTQHNPGSNVTIVDGRGGGGFFNENIETGENGKR